MDEFKNFAAKVMGMADDEAAALLDADGNIKSDAWEVLASKDKERIRRLKDEHKDDLTTKFNEGHAKAKREERAKFEDEIRSHFGIESNAQGLDLIKDALSVGSKDDVRTHPEYLALEKKLQSEFIPKDDFEIIKSEYETYKTQVERDKVFGRVKTDAKTIFHGMNPILPKDQKRASNQETEFLNKLEQYDFQLQPDGNHVVMTKEGKRLTNDNENPVGFAELVKNLTNAYFDVQTQEPAGNSGVDEPPTSGATSFKSQAEFYQAYGQERDTTKRVQMFEKAKADGLV